jgi:hypothetical protein
MGVVYDHWQAGRNLSLCAGQEHDKIYSVLVLDVFFDDRGADAICQRRLISVCFYVQVLDRA